MQTEAQNLAGAAGTQTSEAVQLADALGISPDEPIEVGGQSVKIQPLTINQLAEIMLAVERLAAKGITVPTNADDVKEFSAVQLVLRGGQDFKQILAIASEKDEAFIGGLNFADAARLAGKIWTVNKDFFDRNRLDILKAFGLDEETVAAIKELAGSLKSLAAAKLAESQTSEA